MSTKKNKSFNINLPCQVCQKQHSMCVEGIGDFYCETGIAMWDWEEMSLAVTCNGECLRQYQLKQKIDKMVI